MIRHNGKTIHMDGIIVNGNIDMKDGVIENLNRLCLDRWSFDMNELGELCINYDDEVRAKITHNNEITINLHHERYFMVQNVNIENCIGLFVSNMPAYYNMDISQRAGKDALPTIYLSTRAYDPTIIGVIINYEKYERTIKMGTIESVHEQMDEVNRVIVSNRGSCSAWVCDINGSFDNGDYITSSCIPGYGMRQDDNIKYNYTGPKITQICNFKPGIVLLVKPVSFDDNGPVYDHLKNPKGELISDIEYEIKFVDSDGKDVSRATFIEDLKNLAGGDDIYINNTTEILPELLLRTSDRKIFRVAKVGVLF